MSKKTLPAVPEPEHDETAEAPNRLLEFLKAKRERGQGFQNQFKGHRPDAHGHAKLKERVRRRP